MKNTESGAFSGHDADQKAKGRKRHIVTDTEDDMPHGAIRIRMAGIQSCGGVPAVISTVCGNLPTPTLVFADGGYAGTSWKSLCSTWTGRPLRPSDGQSRRKGLPSFQDAGWRREGFDTILYGWLIYIGIDAISVADSEFHFTNTPNAIGSAPDLTHSSGHKS